MYFAVKKEIAKHISSYSEERLKQLKPDTSYKVCD